MPPGRSSTSGAPAPGATGTCSCSSRPTPTSWARSTDAVRTYLAWKSVDEDKPNLTLDAFQVNQIATKRKEADDTVTARIPEAYQWLLVPTQPDPLGPVDLPATRLTGGGSLAVRAGTKLRSDGGVIVQVRGGHPAPRARPAPGDLVVGRRRPQVPLGPVLDLRLPAPAAGRVRPDRGGPRRGERLRLARLVRLRLGQGRGRAVPRARHGRAAVRAARRRVGADRQARDRRGAAADRLPDRGSPTVDDDDKKIEDPPTNRRPFARSPLATSAR